MTSEPARPARPAEGALAPVATPPVAAPKGPVARLVDQILVLGPVRWLIPILDAYDAAGGALLASGLAFNSLFAILPAILLMIAVVGVLLGDSVRLAVISANLSVSFPPLAGFFTVALRSFAQGAISYSIVGVVALIWGASRFYQSLDDAMARIFQSTRRRDPIRRSLLGILSVLVFAAVIGGLIGVSAFVGNGVPGTEVGAAILASAIGTLAASVALFSAGLAIVYRFVPTNRPSWRMIGRPALIVGFFAATFTALFAAVTPQLVGSLQVYGAFVAVFAAMIWLSFVCQAVMIGAAWVHRRVVVDAAARGESTGAAGIHEGNRDPISHADDESDRGRARQPEVLR